MFHFSVLNITKLFLLEYHHINRRAAQLPAGPPPPQYEQDQALAGSTAYAKNPHGRVGPVYTFVKTDPKANFKWGVRHVAGVQYGR